jgi:hypothetical protein
MKIGRFFYAGYQASKVYNSATKSDAMNDWYLTIAIEIRALIFFGTKLTYWV